LRGENGKPQGTLVETEYVADTGSKFHVKIL
jgi:hypothetical protein